MRTILSACKASLSQNGEQRPDPNAFLIQHGADVKSGSTDLHAARGAACPPVSHLARRLKELVGPTLARAHPCAKPVLDARMGVLATRRIDVRMGVLAARRTSACPFERAGSDTPSLGGSCALAWRGDATNISKLRPSMCC